MDSEFEQHIMRPGDGFIADECGCSFTVETGPDEASMVRQAPVCCCGHKMRKETRGVPADERASAGNVTGQVQYTDQDRGAPGARAAR